MITPPETRDLVQRLLAYEATEGKTSASMEQTTLRVYEKLHQCLGAVAGAAAFQSLATRALALARSEVPGLGAVRLTADGRLQGLGECEPQIDVDKDRAGDGGIIFIDYLLGLLLIFLGEALTVSLLRNAWPGASFDDRNSGSGRKS
jgi:hypothetical protein